MKYYWHSGIMKAARTPIQSHYILDRTGKFLKDDRLVVHRPIGQIGKAKSIEELCSERAEEIKNADKQIYVFWSGGIDSTVALAELMKICPKDQLTLVMNDTSIKEYPWFYQMYLTAFKKVNFEYESNEDIAKCLEDGVVVTGELFDNIFGCTHYSQPFCTEELLSSSLDKIFAPLSYASRQLYARLLNTCPLQLTEVKDLFWWIEYALNYQTDQMRWCADTPGAVLDKNVFHFGDTPGWNDYAMSTPMSERFPGYSLTSFKMPLKKHLETMTKDSNYTKYKTKGMSWRKYSWGKSVYIDTDWNVGF